MAVHENNLTMARWIEDSEGPRIYGYQLWKIQAKAINYKHDCIFDQIDKLFDIQGPQRTSVVKTHIPYILLKLEIHNGSGAGDNKGKRKATAEIPRNPKRKMVIQDSIENNGSIEGDDGGHDGTEPPPKRHNPGILHVDIYRCHVFLKAPPDEKETHRCRNLSFGSVQKLHNHLLKCHNRYLCIFCYGSERPYFFSSVPDLCHHLLKDHDHFCCPFFERASPETQQDHKCVAVMCARLSDIVFHVLRVHIRACSCPGCGKRYGRKECVRKHQNEKSKNLQSCIPRGPPLPVPEHVKRLSYAVSHVLNYDDLVAELFEHDQKKYDYLDGDRTCELPETNPATLQTSTSVTPSTASIPNMVQNTNLGLAGGTTSCRFVVHNTSGHTGPNSGSPQGFAASQYMHSEGTRTDLLRMNTNDTQSNCGSQSPCGGFNAIAGPSNVGGGAAGDGGNRMPPASPFPPIFGCETQASFHRAAAPHGTGLATPPQLNPMRDSRPDPAIGSEINNPSQAGDSTRIGGPPGLTGSSNYWGELLDSESGWGSLGSMCCCPTWVRVEYAGYCTVCTGRLV